MLQRRFRFALVLGALVCASGLPAQHPLRHPVDAVELRFVRSQPVIHYTLRVNAADLSAFEVELHIRNAPDTFRVAMGAHPEYDDRYWRYLDDIRITAITPGATIARTDSAVWRAVARGGESTIRYRIKLPTPQESPRAAWRPFLSSTGGLVGGYHAFLYILGAELAPSHVTLELPPGWDIATGLIPTTHPRTFFAPTADALVEGPMLVGQLRNWRFAVDGVPHRVAYWPAPDAAPFDTSRFVGGIQALVRQAVTLFGRAPWREYTFMFQDGAYGGLEHANSVTLGASSADLARDPSANLTETAHEFVHAWNLMRIRPDEYQTLDYRTQPPTSGLWFSEGLTLFYADLLLRRAGQPTGDSTRVRHMERLIERYLANPGNYRFSAERVSQTAYNSEPGALGDNSASSHLQGELIGAVLDLSIRDATNGLRSMDDVMGLLLERFSAERGFIGRDIEASVEDVCDCDVTPIFDAHVRGAGQALDFDRYLRLIGLRAHVSSTPATMPNGEPVVDLRIFAREARDGGLPRLVVTNTESIWGRAGLHTGDEVISVNGAPMRNWPEFRSAIRGLRIGERVRMEVNRSSGRYTATVAVAGYDRPVVHIEEVPDAPEKARRLRAAWLAAR